MNEWMNEWRGKWGGKGGLYRAGWSLVSGDGGGTGDWQMDGQTEGWVNAKEKGERENTVRSSGWWSLVLGLSVGILMLWVRGPYWVICCTLAVLRSPHWFLGCFFSLPVTELPLSATETRNKLRGRVRFKEFCLRGFGMAFLFPFYFFFASNRVFSLDRFCVRYSTCVFFK